MAAPISSSASPYLTSNRYFATAFAQEYCKIGCLDGANAFYNDIVTDCPLGAVTKDCRCDLNAPTNECVQGRSRETYLFVQVTTLESSATASVYLVYSASITILDIGYMCKNSIF